VIRPALSPLLDGIELVIFDKDGTLIDFHAMWGSWAIEIGRRLDAATRRPVAGDVFAAIGFDPTSRRVQPNGPLAMATNAEIAERIAAVVRRWCPSIAAARRAVETAWFEPDPVTTAVPTADLGELFDALAERGRTIAVATTDDRAATDATLRALGIRDRIGAIACGDDDLGRKPEPGMVLAICAALRTEPQKTAMVGDAPADLAMGRAAEVGRSIGVLSGVGAVADLEPLADAVLGSIGELVAHG
jgi:phosphoglycolate phosphatase-like HAD superfamily hydrolase